MSGIGGIWSFVSGDQTLHIDALAKSLQARGPDRSGIWRGKALAMVHCLLATTGEAERERQPLTNDEGVRTIVADARLDNRDELIGLLADGTDPEAIGDAELILRAYRRWGKDCASHLLGDFAFAIYDAHLDQLYCARDRIGMRQLLYHHRPGDVFAFATDVEALAALECVPARRNDERIADFLDTLEASGFEATFYQDIFKLPPSHWMVVDAQSLTFGRYWQPEPRTPLRLATNEDYAEAFMRVFSEAVRCRLRSNGPVGAMLSGGTDSNAVAAVAAQFLAKGGAKLSTFSAVGPDPKSCAETQLIHQATHHLGGDFQFIDYSNLDDRTKDVLRGLGRRSTEPFDTTSMLNRAVYLAAHRRGVRVMLDAACADTLLAAGNRVAALLRDGNVRHAWKEAGAHAAFWNEPHTHLPIFLKAIWAGLMPFTLRRLVRRFRSWAQRSSTTTALAELRPQFLRSSGLPARRAFHDRMLETKRPYGAEYLARVLAHPTLTVARERYDRIAAQLQIEPRDPFTDVRVIDFCLSLPPEQFQDGGFPKILLRRAIARLVPEEIAWRRGKSHLGPEFLRAVHGGDDNRAGNPSVPANLRAYVLAPPRRSFLTQGWIEKEWQALSDWLANDRTAESE